MDPKRQLRAKMHDLLKALSADALQFQSQTICRRLFKLPIYENAKSVAVYLNMPTEEVQTAAIVEHMFAAGKRCYVPVCDGQCMFMVRLTSFDEYRRIPLNRWKIPEPSLVDDAGRPRAQALVDDALDLIITPGICFSADGSRLGHGKGYYDRFFQQSVEWAQRFKKPPPFRLALALREQMLSLGSIPMTNTDVVMNGVLTADEMINIE